MKTAPLSKSTKLVFQLLQQKHQMEMGSAMQAVMEDECIPADVGITLDLQQGLWVWPDKEPPGE